MGEMPIHDIPFNNVAIDIVGPFPRAKGFKFLLTYICLASRYPEAIPMKSATAAECTEFLIEIFSRNGISRTIQSDQRSQFMGILVKGLCKRLGINQIRTAPYHTESDGTVESFHGTLVPILRKVSSKHLPWPDQVKFALYAVRSTPNMSTGYAPFEIVHGRNLRSPLEVVLEEIETASNRNARAIEWLHQLQERIKLIREEVRKNLSIAQGVRKEHHDKNCVSRSFKMGDMVLVRIPGLQIKLEGCWEGPFEVLAVPSEFHVVIGNMGKTRTKKQGKIVHVNTCKSFFQVQINRVAVWAREEENMEPAGKLETLLQRSETRKQRLDECIERWSGSVQKAEPGLTEFVSHCIYTGNAPPVRSWLIKFRVSGSRRLERK